MEFTIDDYNSNDGMMTSIWGPAAWHFLHTVSFNYPLSPSAADKVSYRNFIADMRYILPCGKCRKNLLANFKKLPLTQSHMASRQTFSRYVYDLHEVVNTMLCKTSDLTYEEVRDKYEYFRARCSSSQSQSQSQKCKFIKNKTVRKNKERNKKKKKEDGCVVPFYGTKQKCILRIVPQTLKCKSFS
jgi:Erv1 / Alr family